MKSKLSKLEHLNIIKYGKAVFNNSGNFKLANEMMRKLFKRSANTALVKQIRTGVYGRVPVGQYRWDHFISVAKHQPGEVMNHPKFIHPLEINTAYTKIKQETK